MFELLQVTLCLVVYSLPDAVQVICPDLLSLGQYLQVLVLQGLQGPLDTPTVVAGILGSLALTRRSLRFLGLLWAISVPFSRISLVEPA